MVVYYYLKKALFKLEPENAHNIAGVALKAIGGCSALFNLMVKRNFIDLDILKQELFNNIFYNPIGLAAGFDKDGEYIKGVAALGFGFSEIGTITPKPQRGNPKPRLFRLIEDESLQNAMGFNNKGMEEMLKNIKKNRFFCYPIGINIGKNKTTPQEKAIEDYKILFNAFKNYGSYLVVNISSPNTPGLRDLQNENFVKELFEVGTKITKKPILLKIAPDMSEDEAINISQVAINAGAKGIIATNTTINYSLTSRAKDFGGISGKLLKEKSFKIFEALSKELFGKTILISVGGIDSAKEAYKRIKAGASLVQIYTALIYKGPSLIRDLNLELIELLKKDRFNNISEAIGIDRK